jgi:hypothetical protein
MAIGTTLKISFNSSAVQRGLAGLKAGFTNIAKIGVTAFKAIGVGAIAGVAGIAALAIKLNSIGEAGRAGDRVLANVTKQMGIFGNEADNVTKRLIDYADIVSRMTGLDGESIGVTQTKLMTFKELAKTADVAGGAFDRATMAALDMAEEGFGTAESNAVQLGKALNDPIKGINSLSKSGISFTAQEKNKIKTLVESNRTLEAQDLILKAIETQVKGAAAAAATSSGKISASWAQIVDAFAEPFSSGFDSLPGALESVFSTIVTQAERFGNLFANAISDSIGGNHDKFIAAGKLIGDTIAAATEAAYQSGIMNIHKGIMKFLEDINPIRRMSEAVGYEGERGSQWQTPGFDELLEAHMINRGIKQQAQSVMQGNQGLVPGSGGRFQFAPPGSNSPLSDANGNKVVEVLSKIENNTAQGAKM